MQSHRNLLGYGAALGLVHQGPVQPLTVQPGGRETTGFKSSAARPASARAWCHRRLVLWSTQSGVHAALLHLFLPDATASADARRLLPLVEREDLIQVAREVLVRATSRW